MRRSVACLGLALLLTSFSSQSFAQDKVRIGLSSISATSASLWAAEERGLFKKHGIDAEVIVIGGGAARVVSSLISGEIQFSVGGGDAVIRADLRGADGVLVASPMKTGLQRLMVRPEIKTPADLKGRTIAVTRFGSASHWVMQLFLRKWGMRTDDIKMLQLGPSPAMFASLEKARSTAAPLRFRHFSRGRARLSDSGGSRGHGDLLSAKLCGQYSQLYQAQSRHLVARDQGSMRGSCLFSKEQDG
jgi:ABC-type nitrate/sulfonate/bicarbonate transport system substrate-binding protein